MVGQQDANLTATTGAVNITGSTEISLQGPVTVGSVIAPKDITVNGLVNAISDVVAFSGTTNYSLSTIGALVAGNQQYNYWVAVNGNDTTGNGSVIKPFATVTGALAATLSISDTIPININITAGTFTENPTVTRNNTFLVGNVGVADAVIIGTITFNPTATTTVSQGMSGISVVGNVVCNDSIAFDISWYIQYCNITSYTTSALNAFSSGAGNNSVIVVNTVITQNITTNTAVTINSVRLNAIQAQINNTTPGACVSSNGTGSMSLFGCTLTSAGAATASALVTFINSVGNGSASSFTLTSFTYTAATAGAAKAAFFFNNAGALAGSTTINNCIFTLPGAAALLQRPGAGSVAIVFGANTSSILTIPAAGSGLTYAYTTSTPLRANALFDSTASSGTSGQVLTAGTGGSLVWAAPSAGVNNLGVSGNLITISGGGTSADVSSTTAVSSNTQKLTGISYAATTTTATGALTATGTITGATVASTGAITAATNITATGYLKSSSFNDAAGTLGTANQVLTAGTGGASVRWASLTNSSLGAIPASVNASMYQNQMTFYNTATNALSYSTNAYGIQLITAPNAFAPTANQRGLTLIVTSAAAANLTLANTGLLTANDAGFFFTIKNGNGTLGGDITITGGITTGNTVIHNQTAVMNGGSVIVRWTGTAFVAY